MSLNEKSLTSHERGRESSLLTHTEQVALRESERAGRLAILQQQQSRLRALSLRSSTRLSIGLGVLTAVGLFGLGAAWIAYLSTFSGGVTYDASAWGQAGDFVGGVTNPVLTFLTLIAVVLTVKLQSDELNLQRGEIELSRERERESDLRERRRLEREEAVAVAQQLAAEAQVAAARALADQLRLSALEVRRQSLSEGIDHLDRQLTKLRERLASGNMTEADQATLLKLQRVRERSTVELGEMLEAITQLGEHVSAAALTPDGSCS